MTETLSDVLTSPIVIAIARLDGTGEVLVDGVSHAIQAASADAARQDCFGYIFHDVVQNLGRPVRVEARDSEATRFLVLHPSGEVTADEDPSPPHPDLLTPRSRRHPRQPPGHPSTPVPPLRLIQLLRLLRSLVLRLLRSLPLRRLRSYLLRSQASHRLRPELRPPWHCRGHTRPASRLSRTFSPVVRRRNPGRP